MEYPEIVPHYVSTHISPAKVRKTCVGKVGKRYFVPRVHSGYRVFFHADTSLRKRAISLLGSPPIHMQSHSSSDPACTVTDTAARGSSLRAIYLISDRGKIEGPTKKGIRPLRLAEVVNSRQAALNRAESG